MPLALFFANLSLVLILISLLYPQAAFPLALPLIGSTHLLFWTIVALIGAALVFTWIAFRRSAPGYRPLLDLMLVFFPLFIFVWAKLPTIGPLNVFDIIICGFILVMLFRCLYNDRNNLSLWGINKVHFIPALKALWVPTVLFVSVPVLWGLAIGNPLHAFRTLFAVATYPFYALAQLLMFLAFPVARFKRISRSSIQIVLAVAGLFALIHWPNGILMLAGLVAMIVWCWVYLRHPNLFAVALSMGVAGAVFTQVLPESVHHNMRAGPYYVYRRLLKLPPETVFHTQIENFTGLEPSGDNRSSVERLAKILLDRKLSTFSRSVWTQIEKDRGSKIMVKGFLRGAEVRREWHRLLSWPTRVSRPKIAHDDFYGFLDRYEANSTQIFLSGWMANVKTGRQAKNFHIFLNGAPFFIGPPNTHRNDINQYYRLSPATKAGFIFKLPIQRSMEVKNLRIFAITEDGIPREIIYPPDYKWLNLYAAS